jgi:glucokinase
MLMLTLGTGIGSGLVLNNKLFIGHSERGAEVGHMTVDFDSKRGSAGNIGTLESACGRDAIVWRGLRHLSSGRPSRISEICPDLSALTPRHLALAAEQGDVLAQNVWDETAVYLAVGIVNVVFTADVGRVVIGGGITQAGRVLFEPLRRAVAARTSKLFFDVREIMPALLGPEAGVIGAAQWAREQI